MGPPDQTQRPSEDSAAVDRSQAPQAGPGVPGSEIPGEDGSAQRTLGRYGRSPGVISLETMPGLARRVRRQVNSHLPLLGTVGVTVNEITLDESAFIIDRQTHEVILRDTRPAGTEVSVCYQYEEEP